MEVINEHIGELLIGAVGTILSAIFGMFRAFVARVKKLEDHMTQIDKRLDINTALDEERERRRQ